MVLPMMVAPASSSFCTAEQFAAAGVRLREPVRIAAARALAGDGVHVLDRGGEAGERAARPRP